MRFLRHDAHGVLANPAIHRDTVLAGYKSRWGCIYLSLHSDIGTNVSHSASSPPTPVLHTPVRLPHLLHHFTICAHSRCLPIRDPLHLLITSAHSRCLRPYTSPNKPCKTKKQHATAALHAWSLSFTLNLTGNQPEGTYPRVKGFTGLWVGGFGLS